MVPGESGQLIWRQDVTDPAGSGGGRRGAGLRYFVLGPLEVLGRRDAALAPRGRSQRLLLASLLLHTPRIAAVDRLVETLWGERPPANPTAALQTQVSRLRTFLRDAGLGDGDPLRGEPYGYRLLVRAQDVDASRFEALLAGAREAPTPDEALASIEDALALWRGDPFEEFAERAPFIGEVARLRERRAAAVERRIELLLALGRTQDALAAAEPLVHGDPMRERPRALLMEALYRSGRRREALAAFQEYRRRLSEELGLEPSPALRQLEVEIIRHERSLEGSSQRVADDRTGGRAVGHSPAPGPVLRLAFVEHRAGRIAYAEAGAGAPVLALPAWCSNLAAIGAGSDPRSAFLARLAERLRVVLYDRAGMGLSLAPARLSLDDDVDEALAVMDAAGLEAAALLAVSQAGPVAISLAARHPERVARLVFVGTYASGPRVFPRADVRASVLALIRAHWGMGAKALADLLIPGARAEEAEVFARVQRESATPDVAARALECIYGADASHLLASIPHPALVVHYVGDIAIPFSGGQEIASGLPNARLIALPGRAHLPRDADLDRLTDLVADFVTA